MAKTNSADTHFPKKLLDLLNEEFRDAAPSMDVEDLRKKMIECQRSLEDTGRDMKADPKLLEVKENVKALSEGYKDVMKVDKASIKYILYILDQRGIDT